MLAGEEGLGTYEGLVGGDVPIGLFAGWDSGSGFFVGDWEVGGIVMGGTSDSFRVASFSPDEGAGTPGGSDTLDFFFERGLGTGEFSSLRSGCWATSFSDFDRDGG